MSAIADIAEDAHRALAFLDPRIVRERAQEVATRVMAAARGGRLAIVGSAALPRICAQGMRRAGGDVACFIEYDARFWGHEVAGIPVVAPDEAVRRLPSDALIVVGVWSPNHRYADTQVWLQSYGFRDVLPVHAIFWALPDLASHYQLSPPDAYAAGRARAERVMAVLADEDSRSQFARHLKWRVTLDAGSIPLPDRKTTYFNSRMFKLNPDAVIADCGAFDGDSLRLFLYWHGRQFKRYLAIEPDPVSYTKLIEFVASLEPDVAARIDPLQAATGLKRGTIRVSTTGKPGSQQVTGGDSVEVACVSLDEIFADGRCDYLKLDIEGAEWDAIGGASGLIGRDRPIIGVAIYHKPTDIFDLPLALMEATSDYDYHMRSHDDDGIDLVFYAVPHERRKQREEESAS
jgi:FkbM family methyltransferase